MDKLLIGTVLKPQGIRGELKIKNYTDDFYAISALKEVFIDDVVYQVLKMRCDKDVFILLRGIADRNDAELFRNKDNYALKSAVRRKKNTYFICAIQSNAIKIILTYLFKLRICRYSCFLIGINLSFFCYLIPKPPCI